MIALDPKELKTVATRGKPAILKAVCDVLLTHGPEYGVETPKEVCHFLAQAAHESDGFKTTQEYASGAAYEGRKDLGNTKRGDGRRYKGRGIFQLTGRFNYRGAGEYLGLDLEGNPKLAADPETSVMIALWYWKTRGLSKYARRDDISQITRRINGGYNGFADRVWYFRKFWALYGEPKKHSTTKIAAASLGGAGTLTTVLSVAEYAGAVSDTANSARSAYDSVGPIILAGAVLLAVIVFGAWWIIHERNKKRELYGL